MVRILLGLVAAVVIAVGGFFGFEYYSQHKVAREVEAAFEQIRAGGGKASHGKVSFDLKSRTLRIDDIVAESASQPPLTVKIASVTASGVQQSDPTRVSADSIEINDVEVGAASPSQTLARITYKAPRIALKDYSGPAAVQRLPASSSLVDLYRFGFDQLAGITAASVTAPTATTQSKLLNRFITAPRCAGWSVRRSSSAAANFSRALARRS